MNEHVTVNTKRDRLIRFEPLNVPYMPGLLSHFDPEKNLIRIDPDQAKRLPKYMVDKLMFTTIPQTRVTRDEAHFELYD